jgi:hypothetical protein
VNGILSFAAPALESWLQFTQIAALLAGGMFAYHKFARGRVFSPRCSIEVHGRQFDSLGQSCLLVGVRIRNAGLGGFSLDQRDAQLLKVYAADSAVIVDRDDPGSRLSWSKSDFMVAQDLFVTDEMIIDWSLEAGESVNREVLLVIPDSSWAYRAVVTVHVRPRRLPFRPGEPLQWSAEHLIVPRGERDDSNADHR